MVDKFHRNLRALAGKLIRGLKKVVFFIHDLPGIFLEIKVNWFHLHIIFCDRFGFKFWQYPGDEVRLNWKRKAIVDSTGVISFILKYVKQDYICIDIGAAQAGISVPMWSKTGLSGKVISVEADHSKIVRIQANLELNDYPKDFVVHAAISDREEMRSFRCYPKSTGWNTFGNPPFAKDYDSYLIDVNCIDFGCLLRVHDVEYVDVVKIDTEGAELLILKGMHPYLVKKQVGCVIFEVNPLMLPGMGVTVKGLLSFWDELPYTLYFLREDGTISGLSEDWPERVVGDCVALVEKV